MSANVSYFRVFQCKKHNLHSIMLNDSKWRQIWSLNCWLFHSFQETIYTSPVYRVYCIFMCICFHTITFYVLLSFSIVCTCQHTKKILVGKGNKNILILNSDCKFGSINRLMLVLWLATAKSFLRRQRTLLSPLLVCSDPSKELHRYTRLLSFHLTHVF